MADSAEIVEPTSPTSGAAGPGGSARSARSARSAGPDRPATFGVGGGRGDLVSSGITNPRMPMLVLGSVVTVAMALIMDWLGTLVELLLRPRGLEVD